MFDFIFIRKLNPVISYANTNYVVAQSTSHNLETKKIASYNIMCQWSVNLRNRLKDLPIKNAERLDRQIVAPLSPSFIWPCTRKVAESTSLLIKNQAPVIATWRAQRGLGLASREGVQRKIRDLGIGATQWTISSDTGIGQSLSVLV